MYTLFYSPGACSMAVHALLNELGVAFEGKRESLASPSDAFKKANPRGQVPTLLDDGLTIREGAAIMIYLAEKEGSDLLPEAGKARAQALEWLMFANSSLHPPYGRLFGMSKMGAKEKYPEIYAATIEQIQKHWDSVEAQLAKQPYVAGEQASLGDILLTVIANWSGVLGLGTRFGERTKKLFANVTARPAFQKTLAAEGVEYKAAA